jgi:hypothetical protein
MNDVPVRPRKKGPRRRVLGPFEKGDPSTCPHWWEPHLWEQGKEYCAACASTRPREQQP